MNIRTRYRQSSSGDLFYPPADTNKLFEKKRNGTVNLKPAFWLIFAAAAAGLFMVSIGSLDNSVSAFILISIILTGLKLIKSAREL